MAVPHQLDTIRATRDIESLRYIPGVLIARRLPSLDVRDCLDYGITDCIEFPVTPANLYHTLAKALEQTLTMSSAEASASYRILLAYVQLSGSPRCPRLI